jgi:hypothetical protein
MASQGSNPPNELLPGYLCYMSYIVTNGDRVLG